jgi:hypothetical protein
MPNHYHVLVRPADTDLGAVMRRINGAYARYFNKRHGRSGYLFGDRYKSIATQEYFYVRELIRYIHLNPVRGGTVRKLSHLARYLWSGHHDIISGSRFEWYNTDYVLSKFGKTKAASIKAYLKFLAEALEEKGNPAGEL